jgi:hypothetical protein
MSQNEMIVMIAGGLIAICFFIAFIKRPVHSFFLLIRGIFHTLLLYGIELFLLKYGWNEVVLVNSITALISGILGIPGIIFLYVVQIYF